MLLRNYVRLHWYAFQARLTPIIYIHFFLTEDLHLLYVPLERI